MYSKAIPPSEKLTVRLLSIGITPFSGHATGLILIASLFYHSIALFASECLQTFQQFLLQMKERKLQQHQFFTDAISCTLLTHRGGMKSRKSHTHTTIVSRTKAGNPSTHIEYTYDAQRGNLVEIRHNTDGNAANDVVYSFEQDALGRQTAIKVGNQTTGTLIHSATI